MHYLGLALYAEGKTDYYFLRPLLLRLCMDICLHQATRQVELNEEFIALDDPAHARGASRETRIVEAAKQARGAWRVVFVHTDGAGDPERARAQLAQPALDLLRQECADDGVGVAVIPIRETEAWALVDGDALRQVFCTTLNDDQLGVPALGTVETLQDPKARLDQVFLATNPPARSRRAGTSPWLQSLGEVVSLGRLRQLPGFQALETELILALRHLNILH
jgi:hypothetical protein